MSCSREARAAAHFVRVRAVIVAISSAALLSACSSSSERTYGVSSSPRVVSGGPIPRGGGHYKVGKPYKVAGRWYVPQEDRDYDRTGIASWYGEDFHGRKTANGEIYDMNALSAAHKTMPLPSYAYVTNVDTGQTVLVRVNDRGPYAGDRIIDLSRATARTLGLERSGLGRVRVRYAGPAPMNGDDSREREYADGARQPSYATQLYRSEPAYEDRGRSGGPSPYRAAASDGLWSPSDYRAAQTRR